MDHNMRIVAIPVGLGIIIGTVVGAIIGGSTAIGVSIAIGIVIGGQSAAYFEQGASRRTETDGAPVLSPAVMGVSVGVRVGNGQHTRRG